MAHIIPTAVTCAAPPADARAHRTVRWNEGPGNAYIDDACKYCRQDDITLPLRALQKALHGTDKGFGHAQQRSQRRHRDRSLVLATEKKKQCRRRESGGDDMQRNRRQREVAKCGSSNGRKPRLVAPVLSKDRHTGRNLSDTFSYMSFEIG